MLFAVSVFIFAAFFVFTLILLRSLVRLWAERRSGQLGSRFKTKMVLGAMGVSLLPVVFMFFFSYALVNRTLNLWFPRPLEIANEQSQKLIEDFSKREFERLRDYAMAEADLLSGRTPAKDANFLPGTDPPVFWLTDASGKVQVLRGETSVANAAAPGTAQNPPKYLRMLVSGPDRNHRSTQDQPADAEVWQAWGGYYLAGSAPYNGGRVVMARRLPAEFMDRYFDIEMQTNMYAHQKQNLRAYKREIVVALMLITLLLLFTTTWVALFLSKQVTVPIQALAEATREIAHGNFDHRIEIQAAGRTGDAGAVIQPHDRAIGRRAQTDQRIHAKPGTGHRRARTAPENDGSDSRKHSHRRGFAYACGRNFADQLGGGDHPGRLRERRADASGSAGRGSGAGRCCYLMRTLSADGRSVA